MIPKLSSSLALISALFLGATATSQADFLQGADNTWTTSTSETDDFWFVDPAVTWAANDGAVVTCGDNTNNTGRLFIGMDHDLFAHSDGTLVLTSTSGTPGTFELFGYHSADPIVGRLGHAGGGPNHVGTITIEGGVSVIMGTHLMKYEGDAGNTINITNGSLDYTATGFGFRESAGDSTVDHIIGASGSLIVPGVFSDAAGFDAWAVASGTGVESGDITVAGETVWHQLEFTDDTVNTTITASFDDIDNDNLPDLWELSFPAVTDLDDLDGTLPAGSGPGSESGDFDGDGISDFDEFTNDINPTLVDSDGDGIDDPDELDGSGNSFDPGTPTDPGDADSDGDGLNDGQEVNGENSSGTSHGFGMTDPNDSDTDDDTLPDGWEVDNMLDPHDDGTIDEENGIDGDPDSDDLYNDEEFAAGTDPRDDDSDDDASKDGDEIINGTLPLNPDTDGDGFWDGAETNTGFHGAFPIYDYTLNTGDTGTDPLNPDDDGDGLLDGVENFSGTYTSPTLTGTDPLVADSDGDGMDDGYEVTYMLDPNDDGTTDPDNGASGDPDMDGVSNIDEHDRGSNPQSSTGSFAGVTFDSVALPVDSGDLLQTNLGSILAASDWTTNVDGGDPVVSAGLLADGLFPSSIAGAASSNGFIGETGDWVEFYLDTTSNTAGYDITQIDTFAKWADRRSRQAYSIEVRPVGGSFVELAPSTAWTAGFSVDGDFTGVSHLSNGAVGEPIATGIDAVRFLFDDIEVETNAWAVYREIDIIGTAVPVDTIGLEVLGFDGLGDLEFKATDLDPGKDYELKRGTDLDSFSSLVPAVILDGANGATQTTKDENPPAGAAFYRLEETP